MRDTIELARDAGVSLREYYDVTGSTLDVLRRFEALVRADERGRMCEQFKECSNEKPTSNEANRSAVLGEGGQKN
jgi:hypothetical protein